MRSNYQEVQNIFHTKGLDGIDELLDAGVSKYSLRKVLKKLRDAQCHEDATALEAHLLERGILRPRHRPSKPRAGETRPYKIQKDKKGTRYLRLPIEGAFPECSEQDILYASFKRGHIHVEKTQKNGEQ